MKKVLGFAAVAEAATGLALVVIPSFVVRLLLRSELTGVSIPIARVTGIALIGLGIACGPSSTPLCGMLTYSAIVTLYLAYVAMRGEWVGLLLWPAVLLHAGLTVLLSRIWFQNKKRHAAQNEIRGVGTSLLK